jgi:hypothetical protein
VQGNFGTCFAAVYPLQNPVSSLEMSLLGLSLASSLDVLLMSQMSAENNQSFAMEMFRSIFEPFTA